jgi:S1-C subfamily serine protease
MKKGDSTVNKVLRYAVAGLLVLAVVANAAFLAAIVLTRDPAPRPLTGNRIEVASRPAIVLVQANYVVTASVPKMTISSAKRDQLVKQVLALIRSGEVAANETAAEKAAINLILAHPDTYFVPGPRVSDDWQIVSTGSGFFVTQDGFLVTAAHVVSADKDEIRTKALTFVKDPKNVADERKRIANEFARDTGLSLTTAQIDSLIKFSQRWVDKYLSVDHVSVQYYIGTGNVEAGDRLVATGARATLVSIDPTPSGHDVALLRADVAGVPTLALATESPRLGEPTYAIGYPRTGYLDEEIPLNQTIEATLTSGNVRTSSQQKSGWMAWGTDAEFTHGESGGPVMDAHGNVMGIVSYSLVDETGKQRLGQGYFVPAEYVRADLAGAGIQFEAGKLGLTKTYYSALAQGDVEHYKTELILLEQIASASPWNAYVKDDIRSTQSQILAGKDKTPPDFSAYLLASPASAAAAIVLAVVVWLAAGLAARRRGVVMSASPEATPEPAPDTSPTPRSAEASTASSAEAWNGHPVVQPAEGPSDTEPAINSPTEQNPQEK